MAEIGQVKYFCISSMYSQFFLGISPLKMVEALPLSKLEFPSPVRSFVEIAPVVLERRFFFINFVNEFPLALCQVWMILAMWFWRRRFLKILLMYFPYFVIISSWKRSGPFIWIKLGLIHPRMLCAKFGWNWAIGSGKDF